MKAITALAQLKSIHFWEALLGIIDREKLKFRKRQSLTPGNRTFLVATFRLAPSLPIKTGTRGIFGVEALSPLLASLLLLIHYQYFFLRLFFLQQYVLHFYQQTLPPFLLPPRALETFLALFVAHLKYQNCVLKHQLTKKEYYPVNFRSQI